MAPNKLPIAEKNDQDRVVPQLVIDLLASRVFPRGCIKCAEIMNLEERLDKEVRQVIDRVLVDIRPIREENNRRWSKFAKICCIPILGSIYFKVLNTPKLLDEPP